MLYTWGFWCVRGSLRLTSKCFFAPCFNAIPTVLIESDATQLRVARWVLSYRLGGNKQHVQYYTKYKVKTCLPFHAPSSPFNVLQCLRNERWVSVSVSVVNVIRCSLLIRTWRVFGGTWKYDIIRGVLVLIQSSYFWYAIMDILRILLCQYVLLSKAASCRVVLGFQRDPSLSVHHSMVAQAVTSIFKHLGLKSVDFLDTILPTVFHVIRYR